MNEIEKASVSAETMEAVVVGGDLMRLSPKQRIEWYRARCEAAGLDPRTQPFQYVALQGKLTLYATKAATDQLVSNHRLGVQIVSRTMADGIYEVVVRVTFPDGRSVEDVGAVPIPDRSPTERANAVMKAITKAKRRAVLSACGLGMLDEGELATVPARIVQVSPSGEIVDEPQPPASPQRPLLAHPAAPAAPAEQSDQTDDLFAKIGAEKTIAYLRSLGWIRDGEGLDRLPPGRRAIIAARPDAFAAKVAAHALTQQKEPGNA